MLEAGADPDLSGFVPNCLTLVSRTDFAALFRVRGDAIPDDPRGTSPSFDGRDL